MKKKPLLNDEQVDFLCEMINIGAGNAAVAFSQMLQCVVDIKVPEIYVFPSSNIPSFLKDPSKPFSAVSMSMVGDVKGRLFLLVLDKQKERLIELIEKAAPMEGIKGCITMDISVLEELGNILAGVFLVSIHDLCKLNIYHSVPDLKIDMIRALIDEAIAGTIGESPRIIMIENEFVITGENISAYFLIIPDEESIQTLVDSIKDARRQMCGN